MGKVNKTREKQDKLIPGPGILTGGALGNHIWVDDNYIKDVMKTSISTRSITTSKGEILNGVGIIAAPSGDDTYFDIDENFIDQKIDKKISESNKTKPIFIFGLPNKYDVDKCKQIREHLEKRLVEYHVLVIKNNTEDFSAKIYSVDGITPVDIYEIKKYINHKTN